MKLSSILIEQLAVQLQSKFSFIKVSDISQFPSVGSLSTYISSKVHSAEKILEESSVQSSVQILELIKNNSKITAKAIAVELGLTVRAVEKNIAVLKQTGKLKRVGSTKSGKWHILE